MRKTKTVTITAEGRDKGKHFLIEEMPAAEAWRWARRAVAAMVNTGVEVPPNIEKLGFAAVLAMGLKPLLGAHGPEVDTLHDELLACVRIMPDAKHHEVNRPLIPDDIEEITTHMRLEEEVLSLHVGFSIADSLSKLWESAKRVAETLKSTSTSTEQ